MKEANEMSLVWRVLMIAFMMLLVGIFLTPILELSGFLIGQGLFWFVIIVGAIEKNRRKKKVAAALYPILKSNGEVSLQDVATKLGLDVLEIKTYIRELLREGYFENAYLDGELLVLPSKRKRRVPPSIEEMVLQYIQKHEGKISLSQACTDLDLRMRELKSAIEKLKKEGKLEEYLAIREWIVGTIALIGGMIGAVVLVLPFQSILLPLAPSLAIYAGIVGVIEEAFKPIGLAVVAWKRPQFIGSGEDGAGYGALAGWGFGALENLIYGLYYDLYYDLDLILIRTMVSLPFHAFSTALVGYGIATYVISSRKRKEAEEFGKAPPATNWLIFCFAIAVILHALFDSFMYYLYYYLDVL